MSRSSSASELVVVASVSAGVGILIGANAICAAVRFAHGVPASVLLKGTVLDFFAWFTSSKEQGDGYVKGLMCRSLRAKQSRDVAKANHSTSTTVPKKKSALVAEPQGKAWLPRDIWLMRHETHLQPSRGSDCELVFLGDSISEGWLGNGISTWKQRFQTPYNAINLGIGGDEVQHILWRVQNGAVANLSPKLLVLLLGTNNFGQRQKKIAPGKEAAEEARRALKVSEIADGIHVVLEELLARLPSTKILHLAVFPRDTKPETPFRRDVASLNAIIKKYSDELPRISFLDIGDDFLDDHGNLPSDIMPDELHLSERGYEIWGESMASTFQELMHG